MKRALAFSFVVLPLALVASQASAQTNGYAVSRFDPAEKGSDWFANESLDLRGKVRPALGIVGDYSTNQIAYTNFDGSHQAALVGKQFFAHLGASLVLADRLRLGVSLPMALYQNGQNYTLGTTPLTPPSKAAIGDVRVGADLRLVGEYKDAFTMAIGAQVHLPTGSETQYTGDGKVSIVPRLLIAGDLGDIAYAAQVGFEIRGRNDMFAGTQLGNNITGRVALGIRGFDRHLLFGPELYASTLAADAFNHLTTPIETILGAHYTVNDWRFGLGAGGGIGDVYSSPSFRLLAGIEWTPAIADKPVDRDGDGVMDKDDACPDVAGVATDDPKTNGCPAAKPADKDGDGILDADDACPDVAGVKTDDPKTNGCPADKDKDGVLDADDACPDVAGVKTDDPKTNGCPSDKDKDGVVDTDDACPDVAGVKTDDPKTNGCPVADKDQDGVPDSTDACPDTPGFPNSDPKKNGCPALAAISNGMIKISEQVQFKTGSATILPASTNLMNAVLAIMKEHPEVKLVHIEGHTDNKGNAAANKTLSQKRAAAVVGWLVMHGVDKSRMDSQGYGQERPIDSNNTDAGRQNNRRVEFHIDNGGSAPSTTP